MIEDYVEERLDRGLVNSILLNHFFHILCHHLNCSTSDHNPIFLEIFTSAQILVNQSKNRKRFHFEQFWVEEDNCGLLINEA